MKLVRNLRDIHVEAKKSKTCLKNNMLTILFAVTVAILKDL